MSVPDSLSFRDDLVALFPGQGSITGGAGRAWRTSAQWHVVERVSAASGLDVEHLLIEATDDEIVRTDRAQIATFALSMLGYEQLVARGVRPRHLLGHSLGEFSALVASGLLSLEDGAILITVRGRAMAHAAEQRAGSMVALMGPSDGAREALGSLADLWIANINGPGQIVMSGTREALDDLLARHKDLGWRRATPIAVGGAFHSPLMASAQAELDDALAKVTWRTTEARLYANVDGREHRGAAEWRDLLSRQLTSPVQFLDATLALPEDVRTSIEMPPGAVLSGLTKRIRDFDAQYSPTKPAEMEELPL